MVMGNSLSAYRFKCIDCRKEYETIHWEHPSQRICQSCIINRRKKQESEEQAKKKENRLQEDLVDILKKYGALTRGELVEKLNKPRTTIYDNLAVLMKHDIVKTFSKKANGRGRPIVYFHLNLGG
ncbi:MAG: helix-turn-helix transcriptional regulator [Bacteroidales bacterium]|nr:helix-turn-helix transcriptional regulator [Bacteroidales bacterium]